MMAGEYISPNEKEAIQLNNEDNRSKEQDLQLVSLYLGAAKDYLSKSDKGSPITQGSLLRKALANYEDAFKYGESFLDKEVLKTIKQNIKELANKEEERKTYLKDNLEYFQNILDTAKEIQARSKSEKKAMRNVTSSNQSLDYKIKSKESSSKKVLGQHLDDKFYAFLSIIALAFALFSVSFSVTGNAIGGISLNDTKWIGVCFFICGLIFAFFYLNKKIKF